MNGIPYRTLALHPATLQMLQEYQRRTTRRELRQDEKLRPDGKFDIRVDAEIAQTIAERRRPDETDDEVVARLLRAALNLTN